jgi:transglutaminase-like putative cysteine protease
MVYSIRHVTNYLYVPAIRETVMEVHMQPRSEGNQRCLSFFLDVSPSTSVMLYRDYLGNTVHHFDIAEAHAQLRVIAKAAVEVQPPFVPESSNESDWAALEDQIRQGDFWEMLLPSRFARPTELLRKFADETKVERRGSPLETLTWLNETLYAAFDYVPRSTKVDSPIDDALKSRKGVCQDLAHIMIALARELQIPCRYVSGYLSHDRKIRDRSPEGATHAWVEAFLPQAGWVAFDPTNKLMATERHIRVAVGRDYADVPPTRGVHKGQAASELSVAVNVSSIDAPMSDEFEPATVVRSGPLMVAAPSRSALLDQQQQQQQQ